MGEVISYGVFVLIIWGSVFLYKKDKEAKFREIKKKIIFFEGVEIFISIRGDVFDLWKIDNKHSVSNQKMKGYVIDSKSTFEFIETKKEFRIIEIGKYSNSIYILKKELWWKKNL